MNCYKLTIDIADNLQKEKEFVIFARDQIRANDVYLAAISTNLENFGWTNDEFDKFENQGVPPQLWEALELNKEGLGVFDIGYGWQLITIEELYDSALDDD